MQIMLLYFILFFRALYSDFGAHKCGVYLHFGAHKSYSDFIAHKYRCISIFGAHKYSVHLCTPVPTSIVCIFTLRCPQVKGASPHFGAHEYSAYLNCISTFGAHKYSVYLYTLVPTSIVCISTLWCPQV